MGPAKLGAAGAGIEGLAVQVDVELDGGEAVGRGVDDAAERGKTPLARARLPRVADVVVRTVLGLADPLAGRLARRLVGGEVIPPARRAAGQCGAGDPVQAAAAH